MGLGGELPEPKRSFHNGLLRVEEGGGQRAGRGFVGWFATRRGEERRGEGLTSRRRDAARTT